MRTDDASSIIDSARQVLGRRRIETMHGSFEVAFLRDQPQGRIAMAISAGDLSERTELLVRVHSSCLTSECLMAIDCDCAAQLNESLAMIGSVGRGVVIYLMQEGRGAGLTAKARDRMIVQASGHRLTTFDAYAEMGLPSDLRRYDCLGPMAHSLGIRGPIELLTNNPEKAEGVARGLADEKIDVSRTRAIKGPTSPFNLDYLRAKRESGHVLPTDGRLLAALPPSPVAVEGTLPALGRDSLVSTANYLLPVASSFEQDPVVAHVEWFRMRVVCDRDTARESVLLSFGGVDDAAREAGLAFTLTLIDRLPCFEAGGIHALQQALISVRSRGAGRIVVHFDDDIPESDFEKTTGLDAHPELSRKILASTWLSAPDGDAVHG